MIRNLYLAPETYNWDDYEIARRAIFLSHKNLDRVVKDAKPIDCYGSLQDIGLKLHDVSDLINKVEKLHLVNMSKEYLCRADQFDLFTLWNLIRVAALQVPICKSNFQLNNHARSNAKHLFVSGCSFTSGMGVDEDQRYGNLLAAKLDLPLITLARLGSSIAWQADKILQSDLREGDILVWGLTSLARGIVSDKDVAEWRTYNANSYESLPKPLRYHSLDYLYSWTLNLSCIKNILQVENFCAKIGVHLYLANILETTIVPCIFGKQPNFIDCLSEWDQTRYGRFKYLDLGTDNAHPGPKQHEKYADIIYQHIAARETAAIG